jgi:hypothetical protein
VKSTYPVLVPRNVPYIHVCTSPAKCALKFLIIRDCVMHYALCAMHNVTTTSAQCTMQVPHKGCTTSAQYTIQMWYNTSYMFDNKLFSSAQFPVPVPENALYKFYRICKTSLAPSHFAQKPLQIAQYATKFAHSSHCSTKVPGNTI